MKVCLVLLLFPANEFVIRLYVCVLWWFVILNIIKKIIKLYAKKKVIVKKGRYTSHILSLLTHTPGRSEKKKQLFPYYPTLASY